MNYFNLIFLFLLGAVILGLSFYELKTKRCILRKWVTKKEFPTLYWLEVMVGFAVSIYLLMLAVNEIK